MIPPLGLVQGVTHASELFRIKAGGEQEVAHELRRLALEQILGQLPHHVAAHLAPGHGWAEDMGPALPTVVEHAPALETREQGRNRGEGERAGWHERFPDLAARGFPALPEHVENGELELGEPERFVHAAPGSSPHVLDLRSGRSSHRHSWDVTCQGARGQAHRLTEGHPQDQVAGSGSGNDKM